MQGAKLGIVISELITGRFIGAGTTNARPITVAWELLKARGKKGLLKFVEKYRLPEEADKYRIPKDLYDLDAVEPAPEDKKQVLLFNESLCLIKARKKRGLTLKDRPHHAGSGAYFFWLIISRKSLPVLKKGTFFGGTETFSPVLGFLPSLEARWRIRKLPNPRISTLSPLARASIIEFVKILMIASAYCFLMPSFVESLSAISDFVILYYPN